VIDSVEMPDELAAAHAMIAALREAIGHRDIEVARLATIVKKLTRRQFGQSAERLDPDQLALGLDDLETGIAMAEAAAESLDATLKASRVLHARAKRSKLPEHLPRIETVVDVEDKSCPCCGGALHQIGEDRAERLDVVPSQFRVLVTRRPKYACRACTDGVVQAPAPARLIEGGLPTEATIAHVLVSKYADHLPLYRQHQILARQGVEIDRSCLADWVGRAAFALKPVSGRLLAHLKRSPKLFCDETVAPVLDPGRGKTRRGYLWAIARDDRPWNGPEPPGVAFVYAPGRGGEHAMRALDGFSGVLQVDGYGAYGALAKSRPADAPLDLAFCWTHWRREFFDLAKGGHAPIATEAVTRIAALYAIEADIRGRGAEDRRRRRQTDTRPLVDELFAWLESKLDRIPRGDLADAIRYGLKRRAGLCRFLDDGRLEMDNNAVERAIRPIALNRKNALFAGSDEGGVAWGVVASLIETCKLNGVEPHGYLTDVLTKLAQGWPASRLDDLLPWGYVA